MTTLRLSRKHRLQISLVLMVAILFQGCKRSNGANSLTPVTIQTDWYPQPEQGGFYTALANGYYKAAGLDVQIVPGGPYVNVEQRVATGQVQFGMSSSDRVIEAVAGGQPLIAVSANMEHDPQAVMLHASSPVQNFADLSGRTLSIRTGASWFQFVTKRYNLQNVHEIPATYSIANFIQDPNYIQQVFVTSEPFYAKKAGVAVRTMLTSTAGYDPYRTLITSSPYAQQHPEIVAKFVQASVRGWQDYLKDPTSAHALIKNLNPALDPELMQFSYEALRDGHFLDGDPQKQEAIGQFNAQRWTTMEQQLADLNLIPHPIDPTSAYTLQFLAK